MKLIFYIYCILYALISLLMNYCVFDVFTSKILASISVLVMGFVCLAPIVIIVNPTLIRSNKSDSKYLSFCMVAGILRFLFWSVSIMGVRDHTVLLFLNAFGLGVFALIQSKFKLISDEYFKN